MLGADSGVGQPGPSQQFLCDDALDLSTTAEGSSSSQTPKPAEQKFPFVVFKPVHWKPAGQKRHNYGESGFVGPSLHEAAVVQYSVVDRTLAKDVLRTSHGAAQSSITVLAEADEPIFLFALPDNLSYQQLRANLIRWRRAPEGRYHLRSGMFDYDTTVLKEVVSGIVTQLVQKGAFFGSGAVCQLRAAEQEGQEEALARLVGAGIIHEVQPRIRLDNQARQWQLTSTGCDSISCLYSLKEPVSVVACMKFKEAKSSDLADEMVYDVLWKRGWKCTIVDKNSSSKTLLPYRKEAGEKIWYLRAISQTLPLQYMRVLVDAELIFASNHIEAIPHLKRESVYSYLLEHHKLPPVTEKQKKRKAVFMNDNDISLDASVAGDGAQLQQRKHRRSLPDLPGRHQQASASQGMLADFESDASNTASCHDDAEGESLAVASESEADAQPAQAAESQQGLAADLNVVQEEAPDQVARPQDPEPVAPAPDDRPPLQRLVSTETYEWRVLQQEAPFRFTYRRAKPGHLPGWQVLCRLHSTGPGQGRCTRSLVIKAGHEEEAERLLRHWALQGLDARDKAHHKSLWTTDLRGVPASSTLADRGTCLRAGRRGRAAASGEASSSSSDSSDSSSSSSSSSSS